MEEALRAVGVNPFVISTADGVKGAPPLQHNSCTIIKVHGDYLDTRIKNTPDELKSYDLALDDLLDRVADEYGLIVCGWSADYDPALCSAFQRAPNRRYATYWAYRGSLGEAATSFVSHRRALPVEITDADTFFSQLVEGVKSLEAVSRPHPLSKQMAVATLKRYLSNGRTIDLHDLVIGETEKVFAAMSSDRFPLQSPANLNTTANEYCLSRLSEYEAVTETLLPLFANLCYWGNKEHQQLIIRVISRLGESVGGSVSDSFLGRATRYPAFLALYAGGIAAVATEKWATFVDLILRPKMSGSNDKIKSPTDCLHSAYVIKGEHQKSLFGNYSLPLSEYTYRKLRDILRELIPSDLDYNRSFDRFEYLFSLACGDARRPLYGDRAPLGRFVLTSDGFLSTIMPELKKEIEYYGSEWQPLKAGYLNGSSDTLQDMIKIVDEQVQNMGF